MDERWTSPRRGWGRFGLAPAPLRFLNQDGSRKTKDYSVLVPKMYAYIVDHLFAWKSVLC